MTAAARRNLYRLLPDWLSGAFCLLIPALWNGYPLITSDSGAYIGTGYSLQLPIDRPIAYSVLLRLVSGGITLWSAVALQALLVAALLLIITHAYIGAAYSRGRFIAIMLLTGIATSCGWATGQIMPDVFTAVLLLSVIILCSISLSRSATWILYMLMLGCILVHSSNLLIALLTGIIIFIYCLRRKEHSIRPVALALLSIAAVGWVTLSAMNAIAGRGFRPSAASHVFIMSRMAEDGMLDSFLDDHCPTDDSAAYRLCAWQGRLPPRQWDFMWDTSGPLYHTGGWQKSEAEYSRIIRKTLTTPKYLGLHFLKAAEATLRQLSLLRAGDGVQQYEDAASPVREIRAHFKGEAKEFSVSAQQTNALPAAGWNMLIVIFTLGSCILALLWRKPEAAEEAAFNMRRIIKLSLLFIVMNAAVTASLAAVVSRYEARVVWILPFLSILYVLRNNTYGRHNAGAA